MLGGRPANIVRATGLPGWLGLGCFFFALYALRSVQFNVVNYSAVVAPGPAYWPAYGLLLAVSCVLAYFAVQSGITRNRRGPLAWISTLWPLSLNLPVACANLLEGPPPFMTSVLVILSAAWGAFKLGAEGANGPDLPIATPTGRPPSEADSPIRNHRRTHAAAALSIVLAVILFTAAHARVQINFFEHFMLGHADLGHYTEELKNALAGRGLRSYSFDHTRLGWHFVPLMYVLVPGYALWPSPVFLMVCGPLLLYGVSLPVYFLARRLSGSVGVGWLFAMAWLLLPSPSRLVYSNTYGFQWVYGSLPLIALLIADEKKGWWHLLPVALLLFVQETAAPAAIGWGLYLACFTPRRKMGAVIAVGSVLYLALCVEVFIPYFSEAPRYARMDLFGKLGGTPLELLSAPFRDPALFFGRVFRGESLALPLLLIVTMAGLPLRGWRLSLAALPTLAGISLLENPDWLSIKFWHHCGVLPFFFFAGVSSLSPIVRAEDPPGSETCVGGASMRFAQRAQADHSARRRSSRTISEILAGKVLSPRRLNRGWAFAAFASAALGHYFFGFSPLSKSYGVYAQDARMHTADPRLATVRTLRVEIPRSATIHATERLAAHFTDYDRLYTGVRRHQADYVILDQDDDWDISGLPQQAAQFAADPAYELAAAYGSIVIFRRCGLNPQDRRPLDLENR